MFRGGVTHTIDEKGRVALPVKWRDAVRCLDDDRLVATRFLLDGEPCLDVYSFDEWVVLEKRMKRRGQFDPKLAKFAIFYLSMAQECTIDKQGRILVAPHLREFAGLQKDVVLTGDVWRFRIWNAATFKRIDEMAQQEFKDDPSLAEKLGLGGAMGGGVDACEPS